MDCGVGEGAWRGINIGSIGGTDIAVHVELEINSIVGLVNTNQITCAFPGSVERKGWVPMVPRKVHVGDRWRNQLPLKLSSAWTPFKVQGETIRPPRLVFADLGKTERSPGSTYTIFSRLTELRQLGLNGVTSERLMKGISSGKSFQARKKEIERLRILGIETRERWQPYFIDEDGMVD